MTLTQKLHLTLLAAISLSACQGSVGQPDPINPNSGATFRIHAVMYSPHGEPTRRPRGGAILGADAERYTDRNGETLIVTLPAIIDESCLEGFSASMAPHNYQPVLNFKLNAKCTEIFGQYTARHLNKKMAIVLNGDLVTAPTIRSAITGGAGYVEGDFGSLEEAEAIVKTFK